MSPSSVVHRRSRIAWTILLIALGAEVVGGLAVLIPAVQGFAGSGDEPLGQRLSVFLAVLLAWVWVCITAWGALRSGASWVRGSAITIHVLLFAAGTGVLQFALGDALVGWVLILLAFIGFAAAIMAKPAGGDADGGSDPE